jgi:ubiquinone/menaquinone biosynthesis C-methylase UbiE
MMSAGHDAGIMTGVHELFVGHAQLTRSVTVLPDGIRAVTESADPKLAQLLKDHVTVSNAQVVRGVDPGLPMESDALRTIFRYHAEIRTTVEAIPAGIVVTQTSSNREAVAALQQHAAEVTTFVKDGMAAMHAAMMKQAAMAEHGHQATTHNPAGAQVDHFGRHFDNAADWVKTFDDPARDAWQMPGRVIEALQLKRGQIVADVGAGTGYFSTRLAKSAVAPKVYAVDIEPSMVAHLAERAKGERLSNMTAVLAGADRTNLPERVDVVLVVDTFHHIPNRVAYFTGLKARLKPGARLAIVDFRKDAPQGPPVEFRFTPDQISAELAQAGFRLLAGHDFLPQQVFLVYGVK